VSTTLLRNARIVLADEVIRGCVQIHHGRIAAIDSGPTASTDGIDLEGDYLMPGFVEIHTDNLERHLLPRPKVQWAELPALLAHDAEVTAAGVTTVFDALGVGDADPDSLRGGTWDAVVEAFDTSLAHGLLRADHFMHVRCELPAPNTIDLFKPFRGHPRVRLLSLMDHTPGQRQWENIEAARIYYTGKKGWPQEKFDRQVTISAELMERYSQPHRTWFVDYCQTNRIALASHDDTTAGHVQQAHGEGACMSEFPTTVLAARTARELGLYTVMGGPNVVRGGSHSGNVAASELARNGLLDILSSDYVPGSLLSAVMRLVDEEIVRLPVAVGMVSDAPARVTGLTDRGRIAPGLCADLSRVHIAQVSANRRQAVIRTVWRGGERVI